MTRVSVIVTTCNRSEHLRKCIASLEMQTRLPDEVVIADDGSNPEHVAAIKGIIRNSSLRIVYARQEHDGFRLAANRNNGVRHSTGEYVFFTDGDVVLAPDVLETHIAASEPGSWVTGHLIWLSEEESCQLKLADIKENKLDRFWPGSEDKRIKALLKSERHFRRYAAVTKWLPWEHFFRKVALMPTNLSLYREDFKRVNGFDENFKGWGLEDADLALRLHLAGIHGKSVRLSTKVLHIYHPTEPRPLRRHGRNVSANHPYWKRKRRGKYFAENGLYKT